MDSKLKKAKEQLKMNGAQIPKGYGGGYTVETRPEGEVRMKSKKAMIEEGKMDLANKPDPEFAKELARERKKQKAEAEKY
jgi:hypothetical protein